MPVPVGTTRKVLSSRTRGCRSACSVPLPLDALELLDGLVVVVLVPDEPLGPCAQFGVRRGLRVILQTDLRTCLLLRPGCRGKRALTPPRRAAQTTEIAKPLNMSQTVPA